VATGVAKMGDHEYLALTRTHSKTFKTERGAVAWLARAGYNADGTRTPRRIQTAGSDQSAGRINRAGR
jgi:hypothetical protein